MEKEPSKEIIYKVLGEKYKDIKIKTFETIDSTNNFLKQDIEKKYMLAVTGKQTNGRGRRGNSFFSGGENSVYMSMRMETKSGQDPTFFTVLSAVGVCRVIENIQKEKAYIKWVNDIFVKGKKVCGILCEAINDESNKVNDVIVGIGLNLFIKENEFPDDIKDTAGSIFPEKATKDEVAALIFREIYEMSENFSKSSVLEEYKKRLFILGERIEFTKDGKPLSMTAVDIDENANLVLEDSGQRVVISSGEISLKSSRYTSK